MLEKVLDCYNGLFKSQDSCTNRTHQGYVFIYTILKA